MHNFRPSKCIISRDFIFHEPVMINNIVNYDKKNYEETDTIEYRV